MNAHGTTQAAWDTEQGLSIVSCHVTKEVV
jgi:hypothetical protein